MPLAELSGKKKFPAVRRLKTESASSPKNSKPLPKQHPWKVVHACELAREVLPLVEGQLAAGMRPSLLTPGGDGANGAFRKDQKNGENGVPVSLLQTWNHVREWRKLLNESAADTSSEIIHTHSFAAGMAAVRDSSGVVYQMKQAIEKIASAAGHCAENSWLARSFRVAEQFVLLRAAAVVVNSHAERLACLERGVGAESLFLIPDPIRSELLESAPDRNWLEAATNSRSETPIFLMPGLPASAWEKRDALLRWMRVLSVVRQEHPDVRFIFIGNAQDAETVHEIAAACNLMPWIKVLTPETRNRAMATADVVICDREHSAESLALEALARGRALLASDIEEHRDITTDGRGCLWFRSGEVKDIAYRATFLAGNPPFRRALAAAGREHCLATRSAEVVGAQYDAVYRLAFSKRKGRDNSPPKTQLIPLQVGS